MTDPLPKSVLFLCVANSARSQIAEALARTLAPPGIAIWSAGSAPGSRVHPLAVRVMHEIGIDIAAARPKSLNAIPAGQVDTVVTLCAEESCPAFPGAVRRLHWSLPDPAAVDGPEQSRLEAFRETRDVLRGKIASLLALAHSS